MGDEVPGLGMSGFEWTMQELASRGETLSDWNCWWHSHSTMQAFSSTDDNETLEKFAQMVSSRWAIGLVTNTVGDYYCWMEDLRPPWHTNQTKITVQCQAEDIIEPLHSRVMEMMARVQNKPQPLVKGIQLGDDAIYDALTPAAVNGVIWCDEHLDFSDRCPIKHIAPRSMNCRHTPNCGEGGCFSKKERQRLMSMSSRNRKAGERTTLGTVLDSGRNRHYGYGGALDMDDEWEGYGS
jgi:hypothetical protein